MSAYTDADFALIPTRDGWIATTDLVWEIGTKGSGLVFRVPASFVSDGPTIPWWARWIINPVDPRLQKASRLHDLAVVLGWTAWSSAALFHDALEADAVTRWKRRLMTRAVRWHVERKGGGTLTIEPGAAV